MHTVGVRSADRPQEFEYELFPDGIAEIRIRKNIKEEQNEQGDYYEYDEVSVREPITREFANANKETIWKKETCSTQRYELEDAIVELAEIVGDMSW